VNSPKPAALRPDPTLAMAQAPWRWDFFHALRTLEAYHAGMPRLGTARRPGDEPLRLVQTADMAFAPSGLAAVVPQTAGQVARVDVRMFGLFGPNGPLPLHMTAYARERRLNRGDRTFQAFADLFHHRLLLLFYRAWAQAQPTASLDRPRDDRFAAYVGSLIGVAVGGETAARDAAPPHAKLFFAGVMSRQVRSADGLQNLVAGFLRMPVRVESFVGRWMRLQPAERTRLGGPGGSRRAASARLGTNAVLGGAVFDRQHHIRLHLGPLNTEAFESLLPTGSAMPAVKALIDHYLGLEIAWDLRLELQPTARPDCRLGRQARLGWTTWLGAPRLGKVPHIVLNPEPVQAPH
jgi:type VI secretion system protein ImpH